MGCDGGTIPRRDELVRVKKRPKQKDKDAEQAALWKCCAITQELLQEPIVMCHLGKLYNKMSLIEALLDRSALPTQFQHIKSLKDVKNLKLTKNPEYKSQEDKKGGTVDYQGFPYICPVLGLEMNGKFRFVALWSCGCVFSERVYKEMATKNCHKCTKLFKDNDVVTLNALTEEDVALMKSNMHVRQAQNKKDKRKIKVDPSPSSSLSAVPTEFEREDANLKGRKHLGPSREETVKRPRTHIYASSSLSKIGNVIALGKVTKPEELKKMAAVYSIAKDNKVTDVYKSLFTSHKSEQEQGRAHWITYNPFYN